MKRYFVTGIGTGVGKTIVSAILTEALKADYWKPVQCGELEHSDSEIVRNLISNSESKIHNETYRFKTSASPHYAAELEKVKIDIDKIKIPETNNDLIIEGAGGLLVPLNDKFFMIDLIKQLNAEVILVSQNYLGSINHTLLSVEALRNRNIPVKGIIFNGKKNDSSESFILEYAKIPVMLNLLQEEEVDKVFVAKYAAKIKNIF